MRKAAACNDPRNGKFQTIACNVDPVTAAIMGKLFCFDDGTPISFALTPHSALVEAAIESVGGQVTSMSKAHFKVYTGRGPYVFSMADSECSVVDVGWIENCIESNTLEPVYPYLLLQSASGLTALDSKPNARDIGELIKAIVTCNGHRKRAYATLHEQYPHKSGLQWEELHKGHRFQIKRALSTIEIRMKIQTDATLSRHLGSDDPPIITNAKLRAGRDDTSISTLGSGKFIPRKPPAPPSVIVKDMQQSSGVMRTRMSSGVATTEEHVTNVAAFLVERKQVDPRAGYPTKKDWVIFKERYDLQDIRSDDAWRGVFRKRTSQILEIANKECRKRNLSVYSLPPTSKIS